MVKVGEEPFFLGGWRPTSSGHRGTGSPRSNA